MEEGSHWVDVLLDSSLTNQDKLQRVLKDTKFKDLMIDVDWFSRLDEGIKLNEFEKALNKFHAKTCIDRHALSKWFEISNEIRELNQMAQKRFEVNERILDNFKKRSVRTVEVDH